MQKHQFLESQELEVQEQPEGSLVDLENNDLRSANEIGVADELT
jgi:hypothetical protein